MLSINELLSHTQHVNLSMFMHECVYVRSMYYVCMCIVMLVV